MGMVMDKGEMVSQNSDTAYGDGIILTHVESENDLHSVFKQDGTSGMLVYLLSLEGRAFLSVEGDKKTYTVAGGDLVEITPYCGSARLVPQANFKGLMLAVNVSSLNQNFLNFTPATLAKLWGHHTQFVFHLSDAESQLVEKEMIKIEGAAQRTGHLFRNQLVQLLVWETHLEIINIIENIALPEYSTRKNELCNRFARLMLAYGRTNFIVAFYADTLGVTTSYLTNTLKDVTGHSAGDYIDEARMNEAKKMLRNTEMTLEEISAKLCFCDQSSFGKYFKKHAGTTPRHYKINR